MDDTYDNGQPVNTVFLRESTGFVAWNLPNGTRLFSSLAEHTKSFPEIFRAGDNWRNRHNAGKRDRMNTDV